MTASTDVSRRRFARMVCGVAVAGSIAGCSGDGDDPGEQTDRPDAEANGDSPTTWIETEPASTDTATETPTDESTGTAESTANELDRREANVVGVTVAEESEGRYRFDVSLHHDDAGEDGYANWWQIETLSGERIGRRDLAHPHSEQPFTRSTTVDVPASISCVVVRGHDQTHGYGGQAMLVGLEVGATAPIDGGAEPADVTAEDCP